MGWRDDVLQFTETYEQVRVTGEVLLSDSAPFAAELAETVDAELRDNWAADVHVGMNPGQITATLIWYARRDDVEHAVVSTRRALIRQLVDVCSDVEGVVGVR